MQKPLYDYDIYPKVVLEGKGTDIHIRPMSPALAFEQDRDYEIEILPTTGSLEGTDQAYPRIAVHPRDGVLSFFWAFEGEQEYFIRLHRTDRDRPFLCECQLSVYSVKPDLFGRRPYRGDFHVHTTCSDGREVRPSWRRCTVKRDLISWRSRIMACGSPRKRLWMPMRESPSICSFFMAKRFTRLEIIFISSTSAAAFL